jgi:hypothetical protein
LGHHSFAIRFIIVLFSRFYYNKVMAFTDLELKMIENTVGTMCKRRSPPHLRDELQMIYKINDYAVEIYEHRPRWNNPAEWIDEGIAKLLYTKSTKKWKLFWMRSDLKWHRYEPLPESPTIEKLVAEVDRDPHGAFFG